MRTEPQRAYISTGSFVTQRQHTRQTSSRRSIFSAPISLPSSFYTILNDRLSAGQWRRYTRARQVKWPGWKIHRPGSSPGFALPSPAYCFASVIVWTEKNVTISDSFICFILTVKRRWRPVSWGQLKRSSTFLRNKWIRVTWLEDFLTSKWPNSFTVLASPLLLGYCGFWINACVFLLCRSS